jgi:hypothetical protein
MLNSNYIINGILNSLILSMGYLTVLYYQWDTQQSYIINGILNSLILSMGYLTVLYYQWDVNRSSYNLL